MHRNINKQIRTCWPHFFLYLKLSIGNYVLEVFHIYWSVIRGLIIVKHVNNSCRQIQTSKHKASLQGHHLNSVYMYKVCPLLNHAHVRTKCYLRNLITLFFKGTNPSFILTYKVSSKNSVIWIKAMPNWNFVKRQLKFDKPRYLFTKTLKPTTKTHLFYDKNNAIYIKRHHHNMKQWFELLMQWLLLAWLKTYGVIQNVSFLENNVLY